MTRFCPFCGQSNEDAYSFCHRCGRALPSPIGDGSSPASRPGTPMSAPASPPPPSDWTGAPPAFQPATAAPSWDDDSSFERPLTEAERASLQRIQRAPIVALGRAFGTLLGLIPLFFVIMGFAGSPFEVLPTTVILIVAPIVAVVLASASFVRRGSATVALSRGTVRELSGVPGTRTVRPPSSVEVELGSTRFTLRRPQAALIGDGCMNTIAFVLTSLPGLGPRRPGTDPALVLGINGRPMPRFATCHVAAPAGTPDAVRAAKASFPAAIAR